MITVARRNYWGVLAFWLVIAALIGARIAMPTTNRAPAQQAEAR